MRREGFKTLHNNENANITQDYAKAIQMERKVSFKAMFLARKTVWMLRLLTETWWSITMFITYITSRIIWRNLAPLIQILAEQSFYGLLITRTGPKQTPQHYWISPWCFRRARKLGIIYLPLRLTTEQSISFANPVTMKAKWTLLLKRDQIVQHQFTQPVDTHMKTTTRKVYWKLSYCIRTAGRRSKCLGDIYISYGIEEVYNRKKRHQRGATIFIWLILASGFKTSPALRLYLAHVFELISMNATAVMMALRNVWDKCVSKSLKQLVNKLKRTFLLTSLKQNQATPSVVLDF